MWECEVFMANQYYVRWKTSLFRVRFMWECEVFLTIRNSVSFAVNSEGLEKFMIAIIHVILMLDQNKAKWIRTKEYKGGKTIYVITCKICNCQFDVRSSPKDMNERENCIITCHNRKCRSDLGTLYLYPPPIGNRGRNCDSEPIHFWDPLPWLSNN